MRTTFTAEIRVLLCENCGAPLEAPLAGGAMHCTYCRAQNVVATRDERPNGVPMMRVHVQVVRDGAAPYDASFTTLTPPGLVAQLHPGAQVPLRVHPQKRDKLILELS